MPAFGPSLRAEGVLSPFHRKRNLPDQLRVRMGAELRRYHSWNGYLCSLFRPPRDPEQALAKGRCQDADCERLIGVNVYGSGARLVITVAH
jgi:hypothetical protein